MIKCMNCDWVYQLETPYISDAVTKTFRTCPRWFCTNSDMEYKPFYFSEGKPGRMRCNRCGKTWKVDPKTGTYERYTQSTRNRESLTIESDGRAWQGHWGLQEGCWTFGATSRVGGHSAQSEHHPSCSVRASRSGPSEPRTREPDIDTTSVTDVEAPRQPLYSQ